VLQLLVLVLVMLQPRAMAIIHIVQTIIIRIRIEYCRNHRLHPHHDHNRNTLTPSHSLPIHKMSVRLQKRNKNSISNIRRKNSISSSSSNTHVFLARLPSLKSLLSKLIFPRISFVPIQIAILQAVKRSSMVTSNLPMENTVAEG